MKLSILDGEDLGKGCVKFNCDGFQNDKLGLAGCGGLLMNSYDTWLKGYSRKLGNCDALHAEMWCMYLGLDLARIRDHAFSCLKWI
ncbi:hypothetical protein L195_g030803 [Trifolium pratense]|uniref:RNase H type-1 domain-containing protein n=1 Tax=Trifolium pratense TaxID=57577 RepID=A0A2K3L8M4_TRIPR|nr:hypothetical protein L195_g030803 [Trifolium pratense]